MSLMELFSNYTQKTKQVDSEPKKGNHGNRPTGAAVTATAPATASGNQSNQGNHENIVNEVKFESENIREYLAERAAIMEFDGGLFRKDAEQAAATAIRVYCYRVKDKPGAELTVLMPNTELDEAYQNLQLKPFMNARVFRLIANLTRKTSTINYPAQQELTHDNISNPVKS